MSFQSTHPLGIDDHKDVYEALEDISAKWDLLVIRLDVGRNAVEKIQSDHSGAERRLSAVLDEWLRKKLTGSARVPSWKWLCEGVEKIDRGLAEAVIRQHQCGCVQCSGVSLPLKCSLEPPEQERYDTLLADAVKNKNFERIRQSVVAGGNPFFHIPGTSNTIFSFAVENKEVFECLKSVYVHHHHTGDRAVDILYPHYDEIYSRLRNPLEVLDMLHRESVISKTVLLQATPERRDLQELLITTIEQAVKSNHRYLQAVALIFKKYDCLFDIGDTLLKAFNQVFDIPCDLVPLTEKSTDTFRIREFYRSEFGKFFGKRALLYVEVKEVLKKRKLSLKSLIEILLLYNRDLKNELKRCKSIDNAIDVMRSSTSITDTSLLETVAIRFSLDKVLKLLEDYSRELGKFCESIKVKHAYGIKFMECYQHGLLTSDKAKFVLEWEPGEETIADIRSMLSYAFYDFANNISIVVVDKDNSIAVVCSIPTHLHGVFIEMVNQNQLELEKAKVLSITLGMCVLFKRIEEDKNVLHAKKTFKEKESEGEKEQKEKMAVENEEVVRNLQSRIHSLGHVESVTEPEEQSNRKDDKTKILREEVEKLQSLVIEKDEDLTQLLLEKEEHEKIYKKMLLAQTQELDKLHQSKECSKVQQVDVGVQFNCASLETDHLQGVTISSSKLFTVHGDRPQSLIWEGHGFELHLPEGTYPPDKDCDVMVDCVVGGEFVFPKGVEPVSAIYLIYALLKPHKSPLLKIQHCVALNKASKNAYLSFYRASLKESRPPYHFRRVKGGTFHTHNQFGELYLPAFCGMAIGKFSAGSSEEESTQSSSLSDMEHRLPTSSEDSESPQSERNYSFDESIIFYGQAFYLRKQLNEWHFKFTIVKNLDAFTEYVRSSFADHEAGAQINLRLSADHIEVALDREEASSYKGWNVEPHVHPTVLHSKHACSFGYEKRVSVPPICVMTVAGDNTVTNYVKWLNLPVHLKGALIGDDQEFKFYIKRTMEENDTPVHVQPGPNALKVTTEGGAASQLVDIEAVISSIKEIKEVLNKNFAKLKTVVENSIQEVSAELFASRLISNGTNKKPSYEAIITELLSGLDFKNTLPLIIQHCEKLFHVFYRLGGPFADAGDLLKQSIIEKVREKLNINLSFD